ncbi:MAG: hypothetical protein GY920_08015 [Aliivibrio sp.]|nr:hypothetical protein [Aliivibrio sp.]
MGNDTEEIVATATVFVMEVWANDFYGGEIAELLDYEGSTYQFLPLFEQGNALLHPKALTAMNNKFKSQFECGVGKFIVVHELEVKKEFRGKVSPACL